MPLADLVTDLLSLPLVTYRAAVAARKYQFVLLRAGGR